MNYDQIPIIRSNRKTLALEFTRQGELIVRAPRQTSLSEIQRFIHTHRDWIDCHAQKVRERQDQLASISPFSQEELRELAESAARVIPERVAHYAPLVGVTYGRISIRKQRARWGSCTAQGNLSFNCLLMLAPPDVLDSVVVHELCHRKEMNHSPRFYREVYRVFPDYDRVHAWLKEHGSELTARLPG